MVTINSASAPFVTAAQFVVIYDWRTLADLLVDATVPLANQAAVVASAVLSELLMEGAGQIEMAVTLGNRYAPADLTLLAASATVAGARLRRLNADVTMELCWRRRPDKDMPNMPQWEEAQRMLEALSKGELIFGFQENMDAGLLSDQRDSESDVNRRTMPSTIAAPMLGRRTNRIPQTG